MADENTDTQAEPAGHVEPTNETDPFRLSMDDLGAEINSAVLRGEMPDDLANIPEPGEEPASEESEDTEEESEPEVEEGTPESEPTVEAEPTGEPSTEEVPTDDEIRDAELDLLQAQVKHFEALAGRNQGELGQLRKTNEELLKQLQNQMRGVQPEAEDYPEHEPAPRPARSFQPQQPASDSQGTYLVHDAITKAWSAFGQSVGGEDIVQKDAAGNLSFTEDFQKALAPQADTIGRLFTANDPMMVYEEFTRILQTAHLKVQKDRKLARLNELKRRKVSQVDELKKRKRVSSASSTGPSRAEPKRKQLDPFSMPIEEMKKRIEEGRFT